jgi:hypothetical protein
VHARAGDVPSSDIPFNGRRRIPRYGKRAAGPGRNYLLTGPGAILTDDMSAAPRDATAMRSYHEMKYRRSGLTVAVILAIIAVEATGWIRDNRHAALAVVTVGLLLGAPAGAALGKRIGDQFNRRK